MKKIYSEMMIKNIRLKPITTLILLLLVRCIPAAAQNKTKVTDDYLKALLRFEPWAESVWKDYPAIPGSGYFGDGGSGGNGGIRGTTGIAVAYAVLIREFPNAPEKARRLSRLQATLKFAEETHQSGTPNAITTDGNKWGAYPGIDKHDKRIWQSALWAGAMGFAAALVEKELDPQVVAGCKRVVAAEADLLATIPPPSNYISDSKGEENAWDTSIPALAAAWMPNDPRAATWLKTAKQYLANSYTVPADTSGALKQWITTQTLYPSFAMENHGFYHPSYQAVAGMSMGDTYVMVKFLNPQLAKQLEPFTEHNVQNVWNFIKDIILDSGDMAYPSGLDWSLHSFEHVSYVSYLSTHFKDPYATWAEERLSKNILYRQAVNHNGAFVGESCADNFYREAVEAVRIATAFLHHQLAGFPSVKSAPIPNRLINYPDVGLLVQRTNKALVTVSYGSMVTAMVYPLNGKNAAQDFITSPNTKSMIGGQGKATLKNYTPTDEGFRMTLGMVSNKGALSQIVIDGTQETTAFIQTLQGKATELPTSDWYLMAIENHPLTGTERTAYWQNGFQTFRERGGAGNKDIASNWINIDNWLGFVAQPTSAFTYVNAKGYNRNGAAEDALYYKPASEQTQRAVIVVPGGNAAATAKLAKYSKMEVTGNNLKLNYTTPAGKPVTVDVSLQ